MSKLNDMNAGIEEGSQKLGDTDRIAGIRHEPLVAYVHNLRARVAELTAKEEPLSEQDVLSINVHAQMVLETCKCAVRAGFNATLMAEIALEELTRAKEAINPTESGYINGQLPYVIEALSAYRGTPGETAA